MHGKCAAAKVSTFIVSDFCVVWDYDCQRLCITPLRGHGFGSLFSGLLQTVAPQIRRGAVALGKRALTTGAQIAGDVVAGKNVKKAAKRRATAAGINLMQSLLNTPPPPGKRVKRIKRAAPRRRVTPIKRRQRTDVFS